MKTLTSITDDNQIKRWIETADADAFNELVVRYSGMVYGACLRITRNRADAEDCTQDCFERLARVTELPKSPIGPWLHRVATNRALDRIRSQKTRTDRESRYTRETTEIAEPQWKDIHTLVDEAIADLPDELSAPIVAHFLQGESYTSVAKRLGISRQLVTYRAKKGIGVIHGVLQKKGVQVASPVLLTMMSTELAAGVIVPASTMAGLGKTALAGTAQYLNAAQASATAATVTTAGGLIMTKTTVIAICAAGALVCASVIHVIKDEVPVLEPVNPTPSAGTVIVDQNEELEAARERIRELEANIAASNETADQLQQSLTERASSAEPFDEPSDTMSIEALVTTLRADPAVFAEIQRMTESVAGGFFNEAQLDIEVEAEVRALFADALIRMVAIGRFADADGDITYAERDQWISEEWDELRVDVAEILPSDTLDTWNTFDYNGNPGRRREIRTLASGLAPENLDLLIQVAREEFNADDRALRDSNVATSRIETWQQKLRVMSAIRERFRDELTDEENYWLENYLSATEQQALDMVDDLSPQ